jgi:hypothetical protein
MLFGFTLAVIVGFLFTAGRNWTGRPTPAGWPLAALALLWLARAVSRADTVRRRQPRWRERRVSARRGGRARGSLRPRRQAAATTSSSSARAARRRGGVHPPRAARHRRRAAGLGVQVASTSSSSSSP